jgi:hypothetical protein
MYEDKLLLTAQFSETLHALTAIFPKLINNSLLTKPSGLEVTLLNFPVTFDILIVASFIKLSSFL